MILGCLVIALPPPPALASRVKLVWGSHPFRDPRTPPEVIIIRTREYTPGEPDHSDLACPTPVPERLLQSAK